jgi:site-specific DNA-methyltransferase (adenine-specific)
MSNNISNEKILKIVDTFDECAMMYFDGTTNELYENTDITNYNVERPHTNFFECLLKCVGYFLDGDELKVDEEKVEEQIKQKLDDLKKYLNEEGVNSEEVRRAFLLLDIKGFKNVNFPLDLITPDAISIIITELIKYSCSKEKINLLDFNFGVGNLAFTIANHLDKDVHLIGFDNHSLLASIATMKANMMNTMLDMYHEDCLDFYPSEIDVVVSDIATYDYQNDLYHSSLYEKGVRYFPYLAIEHFLELKGDVTYIYLIDKDFFSQKGNDLFREMLREKGTIKSLIALPENFFLNDTFTKSILILNNKPSTIHSSTEVFVLPLLQENKMFMNVMKKIEEHLKK